MELVELARVLIVENLLFGREAVGELDGFAVLELTGRFFSCRSEWSAWRRSSARPAASLQTWALSVWARRPTVS